jgi:hypothetical protein
MGHLKPFVYIWILLILSPVVRAQEPWTLEKDKDGIQVYTRKNTEMSFKEFKAVMEIDASVSAFLAVMYDVEALSKWSYHMKDSRLLERPDQSRQKYYAIAGAPWPYKDREAIYSHQFKWNKDSGILDVRIDLEDGNTEGGKYVNMGGSGRWEVTQLTNGRLKVLLQMQIDPGGSIKAWLANLFVTDSPFQTMQGLRVIIRQDKYQNQYYELLDR